MLIEKFTLSAEKLTNVGLKPIEMTRLGHFVALTGKNGAGKSRILNALESYVQQRNGVVGNMSNIERSIQELENAIKLHPPENPNQTSWKLGLEHSLSQKIIATSILFPQINTPLGVLKFVPKKLELVDSRGHNKLILQNHFKSTREELGLANFETKCFSYIQQVQERWWNATHQLAANESSAKQEAEVEYERLQTLIQQFLKTKIARSIDGDATLFDKTLAEAGLSDGQKVLIQLAVALHAQNKNLDNTVFVMDEPENHLHPSALIEFLEAIREIAQNSQFWIATHSVPLLAYIAHQEPMSIWYVEDGEVKNAGSKPEKVLEGLLGGDEQIGYLKAFTSLPAQFAALTFASECLLPPKTVEYGKNDSQINQINGLLDLNSGNPVSLLDYGSGKSRLLSGLAEILSEQEKHLPDYIHYFAFDKFESDKEHAVATIEKIYNDGTHRHFASSDEFFSHKDGSSIDVVVMCNVLHEIPPNEWLELFKTSSLINRSLKDSGSLLIVEDQNIPTGEKAHKFGFLILDTPHLRTLFSVTEEDMRNGLFQFSSYRNGRLKAHKISKSLLDRLSADTRNNAIEQLQDTAKEEITKLRGDVVNYRNGQLHGFWTQQFANASLYLAEVTNAH